MSERAWTPGPWTMETVKTSCGTCHKVGPFPHPYRMDRQGGRDINHACIYDDYPPGRGTPELIANAHLIAAAPELFDAASRVLQYVVLAHHDCKEEGQSDLAKIAAQDLKVLQSALDKARGES